MNFEEKKVNQVTRINQINEVTKFKIESGRKKIKIDDMSNLTNMSNPSDPSDPSDSSDSDTDGDSENSFRKFQGKKIELKKHQIKVVNHISIYRGCLVAHAPGSGKTLTAIASMFHIIERDSSIPCVLIIAKSANQEHWVKEMKKFGLPKNYIVIRRESDILASKKKKSSIRNKNDDITLVSEAGRIIPIYIMTKESFTNHYRNYINPETRLKKIPKPSKSSPKMSDFTSCDNIFFIVDEAHLLKTEIKLGLKKPKGIQAWSAIECSKKVRKILLLTGTPLPNDTYDIENLISMIDGRDPVSKRIFKKMMLDNRSLKVYLKNKISYYMCTWRNLPAELVPHYPRVSTPEEKILYMSPQYLEEYNKVEKQEELKTMQSKGLNTQNDPYIFYCGLRVASNNIDIDNEVNPKVTEIMRQAYSEDIENPHRKTLIYSAFVKSGIGPVADKLDQYAGIDPVLSTRSVGNEQERDGRYINSHPKRLYVEISGNVKPPERELGVARYNAITGKEMVFYDCKTKLSRVVQIGSDNFKQCERLIDTNSDYKNCGKKFSKHPHLDGQRFVLFEPVRFILLGPAGREGLDLKGTRLEFIMEPDWNESMTEQAIARGIRYDSHWHLPWEEQTVRIVFLLLDKPDSKRSDSHMHNALDHDHPDEEKKFTKQELLERSGVDILMFNAIKEKQAKLNSFIARIIKYSI